jgi:hypothetical protein
VTTAAEAADHGSGRSAALWPVLIVAILMVVGLLAVSGAYGFHG